MKTKQRPSKPISNLNEFRSLAKSLTQSFKKIEKLYSKKDNVSFEISSGHLWIMREGNFYDAISGDIINNTNTNTSPCEDNLELFAMKLQYAWWEVEDNFKTSIDEQ